VLIAGEAGVGKSRLISEFCGSLAYSNSRWRVGHGPCLEFASRPYGPILDVLAKVDLGPLELGGVGSKHEQFDAIVERFVAISARKALLVVIEDLHWADAATLDLLAYLGTKLQRMRVLLLASLRPGDLYPAHPAGTAVAKIARNAQAGRIDLAPLQGVELRTFIDEALAGVALPAQTCREIALAGEGNPFFTEELLKNAIERNALRAGARVGSDFPQTVRETLLERLRPFDQDERRVIAQAAVIGRTFGLELLATTLDSEPERLIPTLRRARDFQLVEEVTPSVFRFRHGLTREVIYGDFLGAEARPRHRAIALALENAPPEERPLEALAYHWWAAEESIKATHYNELAGDAAVCVHAHQDAIAFYERALEFSDLSAIARGAIVEKIADRRLALGWTEEARTSYGLAADIFRDAQAYEFEARCRAQCAIMAYTTGLSDPTAPLEAMLLRLDSGEYLARSRVHLGLAWLLATFSFPTRAELHLAQVDQRALIGAPDITMRFRNVSAWVAMLAGDVDRFRREHAAWIEATRATGSVRAIAAAHNNGAMCFSVLGLHEEALHHSDVALRIARESQSRYSEEGGNAFAAMIHLLRGDLNRARAAVEAVSITTDNRVYVTHGTASGTLIGAYLGDDALIEKWFDGFEAVVSGAPEIESAAGFAEIMVRRGRHDDAAELLRRALPDCEMVRGSVLTLVAAGRYGAPATRAKAREYLVRGAQGTVELPEGPALALFDAIALRNEGRLDEAVSLARDAAAGFRRLRFPLLEAAAHEVAGDVVAALSLFRRCGATYDIHRLEAERPVERNAVSSDKARAASVLSARESEIAALAAHGRTNVEIARALSITRKTVEKHLASVFRKLGVASRRQLGEYVAALR